MNKEPKFKSIKIPENTNDLRDFLQFCKDYSDYEKFVEFHQNVIEKYSTNMIEYSTKILHQHFLKSEEDWSSYESRGWSMGESYGTTRKFSMSDDGTTIIINDTKAYKESRFSHSPILTSSSQYTINLIEKSVIYGK